MIRLIKSELYELRKPFYRKFLIAYLIFYLTFPVFFWFFGRVHAEQSFDMAKGIDFFISMPHYLEYAWIWLPILASKFFTERNANKSYMLLTGYSRKQVFLSKVISFYLTCIPLLILRMFVFPLEWAFVFRKGTGIGSREVLNVNYIRYFGNVVDSLSGKTADLILKTIVFQCISFAIMAAIVLACSLFSSDKVVSVFSSIILVFVPREGLGMILNPGEDSTSVLGKAMYEILTKCIYLYDWGMVISLVLAGICILVLGFWLIYRRYTKHDMN